MTEFLSGLSTFSSQIALVSSGLAALICIGVITLANYAVKRAARRRSLAPPTPITPSEKTHPKQCLASKFYSIKQQFIHLWTGTESDDLCHSFQKTLKVLMTYLGDRQFKYRIPWYIMMGPEGSGKSTLLNHSGLDLPIGRPQYEFSQTPPLLDWWFFNHGIVMDVSGVLTLGKQTLTFQKKQWQNLLNLLNRFRPQRPLDGVILAIGVDELLAETATHPRRLTERAQALRERLAMIQSALAMRVPIYIVITKTDVIPGFHAFAQELPEAKHTDILGWSCPYNTDSFYVAAWVDEIFVHLGNQLRHARAKIYAQTAACDQSYRDQALHFSSHLAQLKSGFQVMLNTIFKKTAFHECFFLRGVYFTGDPLGTVVQDVSLEKENTQEKGQKGLTIDRVGARPVFFHDLLEKKIFPECAIAHPIHRIVASTSRSLNAAKIMVAFLALEWAYHLMTAYNQLMPRSKHMYLLLEKIDGGLAGAAKLSEQPQLEVFLNEQTEDLMRTMSETPQVSLYHLGLPMSWGGWFDQKFQKGLTAAYEQIILKGIRLGLLKKAQSLIMQERVAMQERPIKGDLNPLNLYSLQRLQQYVSSLDTLESMVRLYNNLRHTHNIHDLGLILQFLYNRPPPAHFLDNAPYFAKIISRMQENKLYLGSFREQAHKKLRWLITGFTQEVFNSRHVLPQLHTVVGHMDTLAQPNVHVTGDRLRYMLHDMSLLVDLLKSPYARWIEAARFEPGDTYSQTFTQIARSDFFGTALAEELAASVDEAFKKFKTHLHTIKSQLTGPMLSTHRGVLEMAPSENFVQTNDLLKKFLESKFMAPDKNKRSIIAIPPGKLLFWDDLLLQEAVSTVLEYNDFISGEINQAPSELRGVFKVVARNTIRDKVTNFVSRAQTYVDEPADKMSMSQRELLASQVHNLKGVLPFFSKLLSSFEGGGIILTSVGLRDLLINQSHEILRKADQMLHGEAFYRPKSQNFSWWHGEPHVGFQAFGVHHEDGMYTYLAAQRSRITSLARDIVQPILDFLNLGYLESAAHTLPLVMAWSNMIKQLDAYEKKAPNNSIGLLEDYLLLELNAMTLVKCMTEKPFYEGDFFLKHRRDLQRQVKKRCVTLANAHMQTSYNKMAQFFNVALAQTYPFVDRVDKELTDNTSVARYEDVNSFLGLLGQVTEADEQALKKASQDSQEADKALRFLQRCKAVQPLLKISLPQRFDNSFPKANLKVELRTNQSQENLVETLIDYGLILGHSALNKKGNNETKIVAMVSGCPIQVFFDFSLNTHYYPTKSPTNKHLKTSVRNKNSVGQQRPQAVFDYTKEWGLIRLLQTHRVNMDKEKPGVFRLEFTVPVQMSQYGMTGSLYHLQFFMDIGFLFGEDQQFVEHMGLVFPTTAPLVKEIS